MTNTLKLTYLGEDDWSRPVYKDENEKLWKDVEMNSTKLKEGKKIDKYALCTVVNNELDGEPDTPMGYIKKYNDVEIELIFDKVEKPCINSFDYQMLGRLQSDCDYYLGYGNRYAKNLWAGNEADQIAKMKELWSSFAEDQKPEWLTWEQILQYEKEMIK